MHKFQFMNQDHENRFQEQRSSMAERYRFNKEYLAVTFLIAGNEELERKVSPYFDTARGGLDSMAMFEKEDFSSGIGRMAKLAVHLFNDNESVAPLDLINVLSDANFELCLQAMRVRRYGIDATYANNEEISY